MIPQFISDITVELIDSAGDDAAIIHAAWVSTKGNSSDEIESNDYKLINFLMKHRHGTPFEQGWMKFRIHAPIFVWREWHRHRIGFCLSGDTDVWAESYAKGSGRTLRKRNLAELYTLWTEGVTDTIGRTRFLPSVYNQQLRTLNEETGFFELGGIEDITQSGIKECVLVQTEHKKNFSVKCSKDHLILTSEGWAKAGELTKGSLVAVSGKKSLYGQRQIPPSLRAGIGVWTSMQRTSLIKETDRCYVCQKRFSREELVLDHVIPVTENLEMALVPTNLKPCCETCHREKTNSEQILANRCNVAGVRYERLTRKPVKVSEEMTYDISMKGPNHNFIANGIVVHNSYNEESGRYKQLDPVFYIPPRDRPMMKVDSWKPGRPKFTICEDDVTYNQLLGNLTCIYSSAYQMYEENLDLGIDPGLARDCLPVGIFSSCYVSCNPRSLMAFLSLRTYEEDATFVSYPLYEIEVAARKCEDIFAELFPRTYKAFCDNGRVGP